MRRFFKNQQGITMIEVLVTVAILAIVVVPCLSAFVMAQKGNVKAAQTTDAYTEAANLMEELKGNYEDYLGDEDSGVITENFENISAYYEKTATHYIVTIYAGEPEPAEGEPKPDDSVQYILKGVIVP